MKTSGYRIVAIILPCPVCGTETRVEEIKMEEYTIYILRSEKTGRHYIGYTSNLDRRLIQHNEGLNRSTKSGIPWKIIYTETGYKSREEALKREKEIKSWKGGIKFKQLIEN